MYAQFVGLLAKGEKVCINVNDKAMQMKAEQHLNQAGIDFSQVQFFLHPTNDAWCRDHGPAFLIRPSSAQPKAIVDWRYNACGGKYPPYHVIKAYLHRGRLFFACENDSETQLSSYDIENKNYKTLLSSNGK